MDTANELSKTMKLLLILFVASIGYTIADSNETVWTTAMLNELFDNATCDDRTAPTPKMIADNNYTVEVHNVTTEDGYILEMHRIPASPTSPAADDKPVVFLMHGILCSSADWVVTGPKEGLGYIMADAGYDVWMGNLRGNTYSRNHSPPISEDKYWNFSWHEMGIYDLPAMIDYALAKTGQKQVVYIGHSQGTTSFYVMASQRTDYNDKIKVMFSLAPVAYMGHLFSPLLRFLSLGTLPLMELAKLLGINYVLPSPRFIAAARSYFCGADDLSQFLCSNFIFIIGGYDPPQLNVSMLPCIFGHFPAGSSTKQLIHYGQEIQSGKFRQYEYSLFENLIKYGSLEPPNYDLSSITVPVHLYCSGNDWLSALKDVRQLGNELGNLIEMREVADVKWSHFDYIWGTNARKYVYELILETLKSNYTSS